MSYLRVFEDLYQIIQETGFLYGKPAAVYNILGRRAGFTSITVPNDVKEFDNAVADFPVLSNSTLDIISSSASDAAAGTGVRTVKVTYLNVSNNIVESAAITLNGTTLVTSVLTGVNEVLWMESATVGSGGSAAGNIRLRINGGTVEVEQISTSNNKSLSGHFMVPAGYSAYINYWECGAVNNDQDTRLQATVNTLDRSISTVYHLVDTDYVAINANHASFIGFLKFPPLCKIKVSTISAGAGATIRCDSSFFVVIVQN